MQHAETHLDVKNSGRNESRLAIIAEIAHFIIFISNFMILETEHRIRKFIIKFTKK